MQLDLFGYFGVPVGAGAVVAGRFGMVAPAEAGRGADGTAAAPVAAGLADGGATTPD